MSVALRHNVSRVLRQLFIDLGIGVTATYVENVYTGGLWPVFSGTEPNSPDECITIRGTVGISDGRSLVTGEVFRHRGFQVRVRSRDEDTGALKAEAIAVTLAEGVYQKTVVVDGASYFVHCISRIGEVLDIGKEVPSTKRSLFTLNALVDIRAL